ncbi:SseB family protein [Actinomadura fibrosa]|uniref:SseB family protein n=1 Tax=Actinomadura fibrosa TaxID=111802 RepID=A0ABW2XJP2_9ACTN|nr:SseB family protein [Actinomadura fibrosa]
MLEWSEFARRLGRELAGLDRDTILIVRERDESRHYVQAMREPDRLYAEAVSNNFLDGPLLLTPADEEVMSEAGWRPPADPAPRNWWTELPEGGAPGGMAAVTAGDYARLADVMVTALRDVQGVRRPSDLVYESFHRHGTGLIELLDFGIETADRSRVTRRRSSADPLRSNPVGSNPVGPDPLGSGPMALPLDGVPGASADLLEPRLAEAKERGDHATYFDLLASADPVLPATANAVEDPDRAELPTITIGSGTYVTVFTSPGALARTGDQHPGLYRRTSFASLASGWPDPSWQLAINPGLPSEVLLDPSALTRLNGATSAVAPSPATPTTPPPVAPPAPPASSPSATSSGPSSMPLEQRDVPNPYGTVDPNALSGPNPVAGGTLPAANGSLPSVNGTPYTDDRHTAIDSYSLAELQAAIDSGGVDKSPASAPPASPPPPAPPQPAPAPATPMPDEARAADPAVPTASPPSAMSAPLGAPTGEGHRPTDGGPAPARPVGLPLRPPHGTRLWAMTDEGGATPIAVYDALSGQWSQAAADVVPAPWTE